MARYTALFKAGNQRGPRIAQGTLLSIAWHPVIGGEAVDVGVYSVYLWLSPLTGHQKLSQHC